MPFRPIAPSKEIDTSSLQALGRSVTDLLQWAVYEFNGVATAFQSTESVKTWHAVPPKPRAGTMAYADGTNWNPGSGEGFYEYTSTGWLPMFAGVNTVKTVKVQRFTANGTYTPSAGMLYCMIECVGGGGGGGGSVGTSAYVLGAGGGASGGYSRTVATAATIGASQTVTVGGAGAGGTGAVAGGAGGTTSVGSLCIANGGTGGSYATTASAGGSPAGPAAGTGNSLAVGGSAGGPGLYVTATALSAVAYAAPGGASYFGGAGSGGISGGAPGNGGAATGYGSGGGGAATNTSGTSTGGAGMAGVAVVTEFCNQ